MSAPPDPLAALERAAFVEEYLASWRHDVRNRLASIRNAAFYLARRARTTELWAADPKVERFFRVIDEAAEDVDERLGAGLDAGCPRRARRFAARGAIERAAAGARVSPALRVELAVEDGDASADPDEFALALRCLIENAAEATGQRGAVLIEGGPRGADYVVTVTDDGPGIAPSERDNAFVPRHTTKPGHLGLGLNVARRIARRHGGDVSIGARPEGAGAAVTLTLPRDPPAESAAPATPAAPSEGPGA